MSAMDSHIAAELVQVRADLAEAQDALLAEQEQMAADRKRMAAELERVRGELRGHRRRQIEAERVLILLLAREGGRVEFTRAEMTAANYGGSFVSSMTVTGNEVLEWAPAGQYRRRAAAAPAECPAVEPQPDKRTPEQWCAEYGIDIADPDGWRNTGDPAWDEPITLPDFLRRAARSTCRGLTPDVWNRLSREAHEAADAERSDAEGAGKGPESHGDGRTGTPSEIP